MQAVNVDCATMSVELCASLGFVPMRMAQSGPDPLGNSSAAALDIIAAASIISGMFASVSRRARTIQAPVWLFALGQ